MAKVLIGNFRGPQGVQGPKGDTGAQGPTGATGATGAKGEKGDTGAQGPSGAAGQRGSLWYTGTAVTGTSTTAAVFAGTGIANALVGDMYLNTSTSGTYRCTVAGAPATAKWTYTGSIKGQKGDTPALTNNLLATVAGTALDAVQGKALDDRITEVNRKLPQGDCDIRIGSAKITCQPNALSTVDMTDTILNAFNWSTISVLIPVLHSSIPHVLSISNMGGTFYVYNNGGTQYDNVTVFYIAVGC